MDNLSGIGLLLASPGKIAILTHHKPDGDALGSSLGLMHYLESKGHEASVITPTDYPAFLEWMPGNDRVINFEADPAGALRKLREAGVIFILDLNRLHRMNELSKAVLESAAPKVMIDHHQDPDDFAAYRIWDVQASSTAELVYDLITGMGDGTLISRPVAECLYAGLMTDTGSFAFDRTTPKVHRIAAGLVENGADPTRIHELIYDSFSENRLRFFGHCLKDKLVILPGYKTAYISVTAEELRRFSIRTGDTEGLVNFPLAMKDVMLSALFIDRTRPGDAKTLIKLSFRSKGTISVNDIARDHFEGGGHRHAAGGMSGIPLQDTVGKFLDVLPGYAGSLAGKI